MAENEKTLHYGIVKPHPDNNVSDEVLKLQVAFDIIDLLFRDFSIELAKKMDDDADLSIADIDGLAEELAEKMAKDRKFKLVEMEDVTGTENALDNYILTKSGAGFVLRSALAVIGAHTHDIANIIGLQAILNTLAAGTSGVVDGEITLFQGTTGKALHGSGMKFADLILLLDAKATSAQLAALADNIASSLAQKLGKLETAFNSARLGNETADQWRAKIENLPTGGLGIDQTWQDMTASRSSGTSYQNTTGSPIAVSVTMDGNPSTVRLEFQVSANNSTWFWLSDLQPYNASAAINKFFGGGIVPNNYYYRTIRPGAYTWRWMELR